jgi:hypothetical protein
MKFVKFTCLFLLSAGSFFQAMASEEDLSEPITATLSAPLAQMQFYGVKSSVDGAMECLHAIYRSPMVEVLPAIFLGFWSYPDFPGLAQDVPNNICLFDNEDHSGGFRWVACVSVSDGSPLHATFLLHGLKTLKVGSWTLLSHDGALLDAFAKRKDFLQQIEKKSAADLLLRIQTPLLKKVIDNFEGGVLANLSQIGQLEGSMQGLSILHLALHLLRQIEGVECALTFHQGKIGGDFSLQAQKGSDLGRLFDVHVDAIDVRSISQLLPSRAHWQWVSRYDMEMQRYLLHHICDAFFVYGKNQPLGSLFDQDVYNFFDHIFHLGRGSMAMTIDDDNSGKIIFKALWGTTMDSEQLITWTDFVYGKMAPFLLNAGLNSLWNMPCVASTFLAPRAFIHRKHLVSRADIILTPKKEDTQVRDRRISFYHSALGNMVAMTNSERGMRDCIDAFCTHSFANPSLVDGCPMDTGTALHFVSDGKWFLPPVDFTVHFADERASLRFKFNAKELGEWFRQREAK